MFDQYQFYDNHENVDKMRIGGKTIKAMPVNAGYTPSMFKQDVTSIFEGRKRNNVEEVRETWGDHVLYKGNSGYNGKFMSLDEARDTADAYDKFYDRLAKSTLKDSLLSFNGGDVRDAAQTVMDWVEYHAAESQRPQDLPGDLMEAMDKLEKNSPEELSRIIGTKSDYGMGEESCFNPVRLRIAELLPKVRRKYQFAAAKSYVYEPIFYPEDDVDIKGMESYGEILRIPKPLLGCDDDEFFPRMATKSFPVLEYRRAIPMPKKFVILVDISGSMGELLQDGYKRSEYAQATAIALAEQAEEGGNNCEVIYFDGRAHEPIKGTPKEIQDKLFNQQFRGGSTNFEQAFRASDKTDADSVVLVSDGESSFINPPRAPLMTLITGSQHRDRKLEECSYRYENVV